LNKYRLNKKKKIIKKNRTKMNNVKKLMREPKMFKATSLLELEE
jgi:hypothetical protein